MMGELFKFDEFISVFKWIKEGNEWNINYFELIDSTRMEIVLNMKNFSFWKVDFFLKKSFEYFSTITNGFSIYYGLFKWIQPNNTTKIVWFEEFKDFVIWLIQKYLEDSEFDPNFSEINSHFVGLIACINYECLRRVNWVDSCKKYFPVDEYINSNFDFEKIESIDLKSNLIKLLNNIFSRQINIDNLIESEWVESMIDIVLYNKIYDYNKSNYLVDLNIDNLDKIIEYESKYEYIIAMIIRYYLIVDKNVLWTEESKKIFDKYKWILDQ